MSNAQNTPQNPSQKSADAPAKPQSTPQQVQGDKSSSSPQQVQGEKSRTSPQQK